MYAKKKGNNASYDPEKLYTMYKNILENSL